LDKFKGHYRMSISRDHAFFLKFNLGEYPTLAKAMGFLRKAGHRQVEPSASLIFVKPMAKGFIVHNKPSIFYSPVIPSEYHRKKH